MEINLVAFILFDRVFYMYTYFFFILTIEFYLAEMGKGIMKT